MLFKSEHLDNQENGMNKTSANTFVNSWGLLLFGEIIGSK
jgi:hypothetical protein